MNSQICNIQVNYFFIINILINWITKKEFEITLPNYLASLDNVIYSYITELQNIFIDHNF